MFWGVRVVEVWEGDVEEFGLLRFGMGAFLWW